MTGLREPDPMLLTPRSGRVKAARRLVRRSERQEQRRYLVEGPKALTEALDAGEVLEVFATPAAREVHAVLARMASASDVPWQHCDDAALASLADTVHPQGLVGVCRFRDRPWADLLDPAPRLVAVGVEVRDPGNAGVLVRCADAAGASAVAFAGDAVDPYNAKTVRASVGSLFHVGLALEPDPAHAVALARAAGLTVLAAAGDGEVDLDDAADEGTLARPTAWLFGNEAHGLTDEVAGLADARVAIPIHGRAESLNLATAAAVCLYSSARAQRRGTASGSGGG